MRFPIKEADIMLLAKKMTSGFAANASIFNTLPVTLEKFKGAFTNCNLCINNFVEERAAFNKASKAKQESRQKLVDIMKQELRYAENLSIKDKVILTSIGWGKKKQNPD
ncbi:MAG: hypothetical protein JRJ44_09355 [Deltaproteobacteria bacterium]|nr:hypothetical protein [Deltaproteobacteria bacterium]